MTNRATADAIPPDAPPWSRRSGGLRRLRSRVRDLPGGWLAWRIGVTLVGTVVIAIGIVLLPLPGPGWLIIFSGLGLLATEYTWAARLLRWARSVLGGWTSWLAGRSWPARIAVTVGGLIVLAAVLTGCWYLLRAG